jgi:hypothetical protein
VQTNNGSIIDAKIGVIHDFGGQAKEFRLGGNGP